MILITNLDKWWLWFSWKYVLCAHCLVGSYGDLLLKIENVYDKLDVLSKLAMA